MDLQYKNQFIEKRIKTLRLIIIISSSAILIVIILLLMLVKTNQKLRFKNKEIQIKRDRIIAQNNELELQKKQLLELNNAKDRYFTITTQNLWEPVGTIKNILAHLINTKPSDDMSVFMSFIQTSKDASVSAYNLLENLLFWARFQQKLIVCEPVEQSILPVLQSIIGVSINIVIPLDMDVVEDH